MNLIEAYQVLANEPGPKRHLIIEPSITQYAYKTKPTVSYRVHLWIDAGPDRLPFQFCEESPSLDVVVERALAAFRTYRDKSLPHTTKELVRVSAAVAELSGTPA